MKTRSAIDDGQSLVDRFDELVQNVRAWMTSELRLFKGRAEYAARVYVVAVAMVLTASIVFGLAIVLLALGVVVALTPYLGLAGAYGATALGCLLIAAVLCAYAYRAVKRVDFSSSATAVRDIR
jgi:hypothetical protein